MWLLTRYYILTWVRKGLEDPAHEMSIDIRVEIHYARHQSISVKFLTLSKGKTRRAHLKEKEKETKIATLAPLWLA